MRARFWVSYNGKGHLVRSRALLLVLKERGWCCAWMDEDMEDPDVWIIDDPNARIDAPRIVSIVDVPRCDQNPSLLVCGSAGADLPWFLGLAPHVLAGPDYALLRSEFREIHWIGGGPVLDIRDIEQMNATDLALAMSFAGRVVTYGGMRAVEAACVGAPLEIHPRNEGEELNAMGLRAGRKVDGLGCLRVADAIEALVR